MKLLAVSQATHPLLHDFFGREAAEAHLVATACSPPPAGHARWTLQLLSDRLVELEVVESISRECVR